MKITKNDVLPLLAVLANGNDAKIKTLSSSDKKICRLCVQFFLSDKKEIDIPKLEVKKIEHHLQNKKFSWITCLVQSILNRIYRKSRHDFCNSIREATQKYLSNHIEHYLQTHYEIHSNCKLKDAKIFFIGDQHVDFIQKKIRTNAIDQLAKENNHVLLEHNLTFKPKPSAKKYTMESWEVEEHVKESERVSNKDCMLLKEMGQLVTEWKKLERSITSLEKRKKDTIDLCLKTNRVTREKDQCQQEFVRLKQVRDQDLINKTKAVEPRFVIAGSNHLIEDSYNVSNSFKDVPHVVLIPKVSAQGEANAKKLAQYVAKTGDYSYAGVL